MSYRYFFGHVSWSTNGHCFVDSNSSGTHAAVFMPGHYASKKAG